MKNIKIFTIIIICVQFILITSSIGAVNFQVDIREKDISKTNTMEIIKQFSLPSIINNDEFVNIHLKEGNFFTSITGEPILPVLIQTYEFPLGTRIKEIICTNSEVKNYDLTKRITTFLSKHQKKREEAKKNIEDFRIKL